MPYQNMAGYFTVKINWAVDENYLHVVEQYPDGYQHDGKTPHEVVMECKPGQALSMDGIYFCPEETNKILSAIKLKQQQQDE